MNRQYSGSLGKKANCQVTVNCHYAERTKVAQPLERAARLRGAITWPVNTRLYMPKVWMDNPERCAAADVPADIAFQTKADIALDLLNQADELNIKHGAIAADCE